MADNLEFTIPGTQTKVPLVLVLGAGLVIAFLVLARRGSEEDGAPFEGTELLASELDQRLREQWNAIIAYLAEKELDTTGDLPISPPGDESLKNEELWKIGPGPWPIPYLPDPGAGMSPAPENPNFKIGPGSPVYGQIGQEPGEYYLLEKTLFPIVSVETGVSRVIPPGSPIVTVAPGPYKPEYEKTIDLKMAVL